MVDIETVGVPWDELDEKTRDYLAGRLQTDAEREALPRRLGLAPGTGRAIVIAMQNVDNDGKGGVLYEGEGDGWSDGGPMGFKRFIGDERSILTEFWSRIKNADRIVTFNGRMFDGPFLMIRSAMLGVRPSRNLVGYRYSLSPHCDLQEVLTFFGATARGQTFSLDYWCRRFGITSPKEAGLDGSLVGEYYLAGKLDEIVEYCVRDVAATGALYAALKGTLIPVLGARE
ncbi:MAG: ribonuclease H-like domain-containing protein [Planctomycetota bacterium]|nr:ribonuclease H-like domain-containing protein [Planctomycetota bacterium]